MRTQTYSIPGFVIFATLIVSIGSAQAQTTAVGPYYATPSWDQKLSSSTRFVVLSNWGNQAVLDRETGLVWERFPSVSFEFDWVGAQMHCNQLSTGNRKGWRLPTIQELASLVDPTVTDPALQAGHPFPGLTDMPYWSATTVAIPSIQAAWRLFLFDGRVSHGAKDLGQYAWCVRGGQGVNPQ